MRRAKGIACILVLIGAVMGAPERASAEQSLGDKIKKIFAPTPTPAPRKHRKSSTTQKKKEEEKEPAAKPSPTPEKSPSPSAKKSGSKGSKSKEESEPDASASPKKKQKSSPSPDSSPSPTSKKKRKSSASPTPSEEDSATPSPSPEATAGETPSSEPTSSPSPSAKKKGAPATIEANRISGYDEYPANVRKITDNSLELTKRDLKYSYGSADPANGGMDCSGFIYYVLTQNGVRDVPRDSSQQYIWVRKAGTFKAVNSRREDTFELDELVPGDLLFWTGTYNIERDPPITHVMIYLGREKGTNQRIMVGASDGRTYKGESRYGVSVFDFKVPRPAKTDEGQTSPSFIGYGRIPGLE